MPPPLPLEHTLRLVFIPGAVHDSSTVTPPVVCELVSIPDVGLECIRGYYAISGKCFTNTYSRLRTDTLSRWERLTGERLTPDLQGVRKKKSKGAS